MKILVGYNGSDASKSALEQATNYAKVFDAAIYIITSMEGGTKEKAEEIYKADMDLKSAKELVEKDGRKCETYQLVRGLTPGEDIVRFAEENDIDHMFVGIEKKSKTQKILLGSTAQYVILKANCPVTTVK